MKTLSKLLNCLSIAGAAFVMTSSALAQAPAKMDDVSVQLDWVVRADHAMFFVGKEKGFFCAERYQSHQCS